MTAFLANLNPVRLADEVTDRLGELLLRGLGTGNAYLKEFATLPAGMQVSFALGGAVALGVLTLVMVRSFSRAGSLVKKFRKTSAEAHQAKAELAIMDRLRAVGYVFMVGMLVCLLALAAFVVHSWYGAPSVGGFNGR